MRSPQRLPAMLVLLAGLCLSPLPAQDEDTDTASDTSSDFLIGVSDELQILIWQEPDLSMPVVVRPDGKIGVPLAGELLAEGKNPTELAVEITQALKRILKDPVVTVIVSQVNHFRVYVLGEVVTRGELILQRRTQLLQAIAMSGGLTEFADKSRVVVVRREHGRERRIEIDYRKVINGDRPEQNIFLKPGDTIIVF